MSALAAALALLAVFPASVRAAAPTTNREVLEDQARSQWDAAHDADRPARSPEQSASVRALFAKIDAVAGMKSFRPRAVAKTLGLRLKYGVYESNEYFTGYQAAVASGPIRGVDVRVGAQTARALVVVDIDPGLGITTGEVMDHFGDHFGVGGQGVHAGPKTPYYYEYRRPGGRLSLQIQPGSVHTLVGFVWNTVDGP